MGFAAAANIDRIRFEQMLDVSALAAICAGPDNLIVSWNAAASELFGHRAEDAIGQPLSIIMPERHRAAHEAGLARAVRTGVARLSGHTTEILALHADGHEMPVDLSLSMWFEDGRPMFGALIRDITDRQAARTRLEHLARCDTLTALPNRNALQWHLSASIEKAPCALLLLDLDDFKHVNDTLGHSAGDELIAEVAKRLTASVGPSDLVARLGGDEFAIVSSDCANHLQADALAKRIFAKLEEPFELAGQSVYVTTSIGIAFAPLDAENVDQLLSQADLALYNAKDKGGGVRVYFVRAMQNRSERRLRLGAELRSALQNNEFELWYQPQVALESGALKGLEVLLRWRHPKFGLLAPHAFIKVLSESVIAEQVGNWILDQACQNAADLMARGLPPVRVGVNLFPAQLRSGRLFDAVCSALARHKLAPEQLELEITESTVVRRNPEYYKLFARLKEFGVGIAFDDFGTGFASLSLLQNFPLTRIKIDRTFVAKIDRKPEDAAIVRALVAMAGVLDLTVIAEGVETGAQEAVLRSLKCCEAQGFRYGRPVPIGDIVTRYGTSPRSAAG